MTRSEPMSPNFHVITGASGLALVLLFHGSHGHAAEAQLAPMPTVSVDMPHGGCRLSIWKDGQASISYGAMPRWVRVAPGTFDFGHVTGLLRSRSHPQDERPLDRPPGGTVALPDSQALRRIDDVALFRSLLDTAWKARMAPARDSPAEDHGWVAKVCGLAE